MIESRKLALVTGGLYLLTFATSIPALALKQSFLQGESTATALHWAVILEMILAFACIGTAVSFYPIGMRYHPGLSLGFVASRTLEASTVVFGVIALLSLSTLRSAAQFGNVDHAETALIAAHDWAFLLGPGLLPAVNALLFGTLLYQARLVPRIIPLIGLIGAPILILSAMGTLLGVNDQVSPLAGLAALPIALWEFSIGTWLLVKGFNPSMVEEPASDTDTLAGDAGQQNCTCESSSSNSSTLPLSTS